MAASLPTPKLDWATFVVRWAQGHARVGLRPGSRDATVAELGLVVHAIPDPAKIAKDEEFEVRVCGSRVETRRIKMAS